MHISSIYAKILGETNFQSREFPRSGWKAEGIEKKRKKKKKKSRRKRRTSLAAAVSNPLFLHFYINLSQVLRTWREDLSWRFKIFFLRIFRKTISKDNSRRFYLRIFPEDISEDFSWRFFPQDFSWRKFPKTIPKEKCRR